MSEEIKNCEVEALEGLESCENCEACEACKTCEACAVEKALELLSLDKDEAWVVAEIAPAARIAVGEWFGLARGEDGIGKVVTALKALGVDAVVNTSIAEDAITVIETKKLRERKEAGEALPLFSSRCDAWTAYAKSVYPDLAVSEVPSATVVCGKLLKEHYAKVTGKAVYVIAVEPCNAKKSAEVDLVLNTDELAALLNETGLNLRLLKKEALDAPFGAGSGSGYICGMSGGVAESIARNLGEDKTSMALRKLGYSGLYGNKARREAVVSADGKEWRLAVVCGFDAADALIKDVLEGAATYDYVEVMACGGGCVGGDAQTCEECEDVEMTLKLRGLGLRYLDTKRAARSASSSAAAELVAKKWKDLDRNLEYVQVTEFVEEHVEEATVEVVESAVKEVKVAQETVVEAEIMTLEEPIVKEIEEVVEEAAEEQSEQLVMEEVAATEVTEEAVEEVVTEEIVEETSASEQIAVEELTEEVIEETPVEEVAEEVVEEATVEEVAEEVVEEAPVEEVAEEVVEETPVEEVAEEVVEEAPVEEVAEEVVEEAPVEEVEEEVVEEAPVEEVAEEAVEEAPVEEVAEEVVEEAPVEEVAEEVVEEAPVEEVAEEVVEEAPVEEVAEEVVEETPVEEVAEEVVEEETVADDESDDKDEGENADEDNKKDPYYTRMSRRDRRKIKRMKKYNKK